MAHKTPRETKPSLKPFNLDLKQITGMPNVNFDKFSLSNEEMYNLSRQ